MKSRPVTQHASLCATLPSCPHCRRDLLTGCLHESFVLFCRCGYRIRPEDVASRPSTVGLDALTQLLQTCEDQLASLNAEAGADLARGHDPRPEGLRRILQHLEAQVLLLRILKDSLNRSPARRPEALAGSR